MTDNIADVVECAKEARVVMNDTGKRLREWLETNVDWIDALVEQETLNLETPKHEILLQISSAAKCTTDEPICVVEKAFGGLIAFRWAEDASAEDGGHMMVHICAGLHTFFDTIDTLVSSSCMCNAASYLLAQLADFSAAKFAVENIAAYRTIRADFVGVSDERGDLGLLRALHDRSRWVSGALFKRSPPFIECAQLFQHILGNNGSVSIEFVGPSTGKHEGSVGWRLVVYGLKDWRDVTPSVAAAAVDTK